MRNMLSTLLVVGLALLGAPPALLAEPPSSTKQGDVAPLSSPDGKSAGTATFTNAATLEAGTADTKATLSIVDYLPQTLGTDKYVQYQLKASAPLSTKSPTDEVDIGTVSGLSAGTSVTTGLSLFDWPKASEEATSNLTAICQKALPELFPGYSWQEVLAFSDVPETCSRALFTPDAIKRVSAGLDAHLKKCKETKPGDQKGGEPEACATLLANNGGRLSDKASNPEYLRGLLAQVAAIERAGSAPVTIYSLSGTANRQSVSYFNKTDLSTLVKDHTTGYGVHAAYAQVIHSWMYTAGVSYEKTFKTLDQVQVCSPIAGTTAQKCPQGSIGAPKDKFARILFAESRVLIPSGKFAIAPRLEYDFQASTLAMKLPLYLFPDKNKVLSGGIALGYVTNGGGGFGATAFINKAFSFY